MLDMVWLLAIMTELQLFNITLFCEPEQTVQLQANLYTKLKNTFSFSYHFELQLIVMAYSLQDQNFKYNLIQLNTTANEICSCKTIFTI
jgi:hypothetical protein